jgi:hypothetical protein
MPDRAKVLLGCQQPATGSHLPLEDTAPPCGLALFYRNTRNPNTCKAHAWVIGKFETRCEANDQMDICLILIYDAYITYREDSMRALVDIPDRQIKELTRISKAEKVSRAEIIRQAIAAFIEMKNSGTVEAFGLWKEREIDNVTYQEQLRSEW